MSRGALLAGVAGGIIGAITTAIGVAWGVLAFAAVFSFNLWQLLFGLDAVYIALTLVIAIGLVVTCILTGIGFYGVGEAGGGGMGTACLIIGIIFGSAAGILLLASLSPSVTTWLSLISAICLLVAFIVFGAGSISMREVTARPSAAMAAGILAIIGGVFVFVFGIIGYGLMFVAFILWAIVFYSSKEM